MGKSGLEATIRLTVPYGSLIPRTFMPAGIEIRNLDHRDLPAIAAIHALAFPDSALTALGAETVRRYYEWQLTGPHDVSALGAFSEKEIVGFCFGGIFRGAMSGFLQKHRNYLAWRVATHPWLVTNPLFRGRLREGLKVLRRFSKPRRINRQGSISKSTSFGILAIAVSPEHQGRGAGRLLMVESEAIAKQKGFEKMNLTVSPDNHHAIRFYESLGWRKVSGENTGSDVMEKSLSGARV